MKENNYYGKKTAFHIHTYYSFDSVLKPKEVVDYYASAGFKIAVITDHNEILGAVEASEYAAGKYGPDFTVVTGEEIKTEIGDIIGFPLTEKIGSCSFYSAVCKIRRQGGLICLPHPYSEHDLLKIHTDEILGHLDFVEIFNCRLLDPRLNYFAKRYAEAYNKKEIIGIDAHIKNELGNGWFSWDDDYKIKESGTRLSTKRNIRLSSIIKAFKNKKYLRIVPLSLLWGAGK